MSMFTGSYLSSSNEQSSDNLWLQYLLFAVVAARCGLRAFQLSQAYMARPRIRKFYQGGFKDPMTRQEAALILGVSKNAEVVKIKEAHRRVMIANHPDTGGSHYLALKINQAKDMMLGKMRDHGSPF